MQTADLRSVLDEATILDSREVGKDLYEICASAVATYDETSSEMAVELNSFLKKVIHAGKDQLLHPPWLPKKDSVKTHLGMEDAPEAAREIAHSWREKVRKTIPPSSHWVASASWLQPDSPTRK